MSILILKSNTSITIQNQQISFKWRIYFIPWKRQKQSLLIESSIQLQVNQFNYCNHLILQSIFFHSSRPRISPNSNWSIIRSTRFYSTNNSTSICILKDLVIQAINSQPSIGKKLTSNSINEFIQLIMYNQNSRRVLNPAFQEEPKPIRQRSASQTNKLLIWDPLITKPNQQIQQDHIFNQSTQNSTCNRQNLKNVSQILNSHIPPNEIINKTKKFSFENQQPLIKKTTNKTCPKNQSHGKQFMYPQDEKENIIINKFPPKYIPTYKELSIQQKKQRDLHSDIQQQQQTTQQLNTQQQSILQATTQQVIKQSAQIVQKEYSNKKMNPQYIRPKSAMEDRSISIIQMQLKNVKDTIDVRDIRNICSTSGYHVVKCEKQFDKINQRETGEGYVMVRGASNDQKLGNLQKSLSRKGIRVEEQNLRLKDLMPNRYLLQEKQTPVEKNNEKLLINYQRFQQRRIGSIY